MKIEGINCVYEALNSDTITVNSIMVAKGDDSKIVRLARSKGVKITFVDKNILDKESIEGKHQG